MSLPLHSLKSPAELSLVKDNLAAYFREEILRGHLAPGEKIVEVKWSRQLGISQASVREALNILASEGYVQKGSGRPAQVTRLSGEDVSHSYELRAVLEGYAARIVAQKKTSVAELEETLAQMRSAIDRGNLREFYERDLQFHLLLAEKTGNRMLADAVKRIILPLFAFVVIRVQGARNEEQQWLRSVEQHQRMIDALKTHDPVFAERQVAQTVGTFHEETKSLVI